MASSDEAAHAASETILSIPLISSQGADAAVAAEAATRAAPLPSAPAAPTPQATSLVAAVLIPIVGPQEVRPSSPGLRPQRFHRRQPVAPGIREDHPTRKLSTCAGLTMSETVSPAPSMIPARSEKMMGMLNG